MLEIEFRTKSHQCFQKQNKNVSNDVLFRELQLFIDRHLEIHKEFSDNQFNVGNDK